MKRERFRHGDAQKTQPSHTPLHSRSRVRSRTYTGIVRAMATRAQQYRSEQQISNSRPKAKRPEKHKRNGRVDASTLGVSGAGDARKNLSKRSDNRGGPALEISASDHAPSRKSTRSSSGRVKLASNLTRRQKRQLHAPKERAARAQVRGS